MSQQYSSSKHRLASKTEFSVQADQQVAGLLASKGRRRKAPRVMVISQHFFHSGNYYKKKRIDARQNLTWMSGLMAPYIYHEGMKSFITYIMKAFGSEHSRLPELGSNERYKKWKKIDFGFLYRGSVWHWLRGFVGRWGLVSLIFLASVKIESSELTCSNML